MLDNLIFLTLLSAFSLLPGIAVASLPRARERPLWMRALIAAGVGILLLPPALVLALIVGFQVFGIDMVD